MNELWLLADGPGYTGFFADFITTFWSGILRIAYAMVAAAPFLVAGVVAAGILRNGGRRSNAPHSGSRSLERPVSCVGTWCPVADLFTRRVARGS